ncbi:MAG: EamA family transporter [Synergistaceae bacterium]|nr:EamA family transporter [Synergistaceae bacterium]
MGNGSCIGSIEGAWTYSSALQFIPAPVAMPIGASNPILAFLIFHERVDPSQWFGIMLAVVGSVLVTL